MKKLAIIVALIACVAIAATRYTQTCAPYFRVDNWLTAKTITATTMTATTTTGTNLTLTGTVSADSAYADTVVGIDGRFTGVVVAGSLAVDSPTLVVDATNNRVGIGTATPTTGLDISTNTLNCGGVTLSASGSYPLYVIGNNASVTEVRVNNNSTGDATFASQTGGGYWASGSDETLDDYIIATNHYFNNSALSEWKLMIQRTTGHVNIGYAAAYDSTLNIIDGGIDVDSGGVNVSYSVFAGDSMVAADRIKAGDNSTFSYFDPGDAGLTQSSSRGIKDIKGLLDINERDFLSINVYKWFFKRAIVSNPEMAMKMHWGAVAEEFAVISGSDKEINYEIAFWANWVMTQKLIRRVNELENKINSGSILNSSPATPDSDR